MPDIECPAAFHSMHVAVQHAALTLRHTTRSTSSSSITSLSTPATSRAASPTPYRAKIRMHPVHHPEPAPPGDCTHPSSHTPLVRLSAGQKAEKLQRVNADRKDYCKDLQQLQKAHNSLVTQHQQLFKDFSELKASYKRQEELLVGFQGQRCAVFVQADEQLRSWPTYARDMLLDLCHAIVEGNLQPDLHKCLVQYLCAVGHHRRLPGACSNSVRWSMYPDLYRLFQFVSVQRGARRIFSYLAGAGHQGQGRAGSKPLSEACENLHFPSYAAIRRSLKKEGKLQAVWHLGSMPGAIAQMHTSVQQSYHLQQFKSSNTLAWLQFDSTDIRPSMEVGVQASGQISCSHHHSTSGLCSASGPGADQHDVQPLLDRLNQQLQQVHQALRGGELGLVPARLRNFVDDLAREVERVLGGRVQAAQQKAGKKHAAFCSWSQGAGVPADMPNDEPLEEDARSVAASSAHSADDLPAAAPVQRHGPGGQRRIDSVTRRRTEMERTAAISQQCQVELCKATDLLSAIRAAPALGGQETGVRLRITVADQQLLVDLRATLSVTDLSRLADDATQLAAMVVRAAATPANHLAAYRLATLDNKVIRTVAAFVHGPALSSATVSQATRTVTDAIATSTSSASPSPSGSHDSRIVPLGITVDGQWRSIRMGTTRPTCLEDLQRSAAARGDQAYDVIVKAAKRSVAASKLPLKVHAVQHAFNYMLDNLPPITVGEPNVAVADPDCVTAITDVRAALAEPVDAGTTALSALVRAWGQGGCSPCVKGLLDGAFAQPPNPSDDAAFDALLKVAQWATGSNDGLPACGSAVQRQQHVLMMPASTTPIGVLQHLMQHAKEQGEEEASGLRFFAPLVSQAAKVGAAVGGRELVLDQAPPPATGSGTGRWRPDLLRSGLQPAVAAVDTLDAVIGAATPLMQLSGGACVSAPPTRWVQVLVGMAAYLTEVGAKRRCIVGQEDICISLAQLRQLLFRFSLDQERYDLWSKHGLDFSQTPYISEACASTQQPFIVKEDADHKMKNMGQEVRCAHALCSSEVRQRRCDHWWLATRSGRQAGQYSKFPAKAHWLSLGLGSSPCFA